jgi:hypothetical protein
MQFFRFDLKFLLLVMSNACVVAWGLVAITYRPNALWLVAIFASLTFALYGLIWNRRPILMGSIGGFVAMVELVLCTWLSHAIEFVSYSGADEYWEDGVVVVYVVYIVVWGTLGAAVGFVCGSLVWISQRLRRPPDPPLTDT